MNVTQVTAQTLPHAHVSRAEDDHSLEHDRLDHAASPLTGNASAGTPLSGKLPPTAILQHGGMLQAKLTIGEPDDELEQEADAMADQVVQRMPLGDAPQDGKTAHAQPMIQRQCADCEQEEVVQAKSLGHPSLLQAKGMASGLQATPQVSHRIHASRGGGNPLSSVALTHMEAGFGRDFSAVRIHTDVNAISLNQQLNARAFTVGRDIYFGEGQFQPSTKAGQHLLAHELTHTIQQGNGATAPLIQKAPPKDDKPKIPFHIWVEGTVDQEQFKVIAIQQVFNGKPPGTLKWTLNKPSYGPKEDVLLMVQADLVKAARSEAAGGQGVGLNEKGEIEGAGPRAKTFLNSPNTKTKEDLMAEIDRRYYEATGITPGEKIKSTKADAGKRELWNQIRDEVLYQHEYIQNLPPEVQRLIKITSDGKPITMEEIDKLFKIAKKIEGMDAASILDYASKVNASTTDLDVFEASLDLYLQEKAQRKEDEQQRITAQDKLTGHEDLYTLYQRWKEPIRPPFPSRDEFGVEDPNYGRYIDSERASREKTLVDALQKKGFGSIAEFEQYLRDFEQGFQKEAVRIVLNILAKYEGTLYQEGQRYKDPQELALLHGRLAPFREKYMDAAALLAQSAKDSRPAEMGNVPYNRDYSPEKAASSKKAADTAVQEAKDSVETLKPQHPLLGEDHLPVHRRIDKRSLALADTTALDSLIQSHIAARIKDVREARAHLLDDPQMIFQMDKMMPKFFEAQGIAPGGLPEKIIQEKVSAIKRRNTLVSIVLGILAIALAVASYGTATPLIAGAYAAGGLALSAYSVYDEYQKYVVQKDLADVGLADDPSIAWLIVAVVGASLDLSAAVKAVSAIGPIAKTTIKAGGNIDDFTKALKLLEKQGKVEGKIARAAESAARSRQAYLDASQELVKAMAGKAYSFPGPLADPDVYVALFKMARAKASQVASTFDVWLAELNAMRIQAKMAKLSGDEVEIARKAWAEAKALAESANTPVELFSDAGKLMGRFSQGNSLEIISKGTKLYGGNTIKLSSKTTTITGTLNDVNAVAVRGSKLPGSTVMGVNEGGINILRSPKWAEIQTKHKAILDAGDTEKYWRTVTDEFWEVANKPWLEEAIKRGDNIRFVSNPLDEFATHVTKNKGTEFVLDAAGQRIRSIFGREVDVLKANGYKFLEDGTAVKP